MWTEWRTQTMTEEKSETQVQPTTEPNKKPKPAKESKRSAASSKQASAPKKKPAKRGAKKKAAKKARRMGKWAETHGQLVVHATPELVRKFTAAVPRLGKALKLENPTRGTILRAWVERAVAKK